MVVPPCSCPRSPMQARSASGVTQHRALARPAERRPVDTWRALWLTCLPHGEATQARSFHSTFVAMLGVLFETHTRTRTHSYTFEHLPSMVCPGIVLVSARVDFLDPSPGAEASCRPIRHSEPCFTYGRCIASGPKSPDRASSRRCGSASPVGHDSAGAHEGLLNSTKYHAAEEPTLHFGEKLASQPS